MATLDKVKNLLSKQLGVGEEKITKESRLVEDLGADSLDLVELLMTLEEEFGIVIDDDEATKLSTVEEVVEMIDSRS